MTVVLPQWEEEVSLVDLLTAAGTVLSGRRDRGGAVYTVGYLAQMVANGIGTPIELHVLAEAMLEDAGKVLLRGE